jgi:hypothetical protein
MIAVFKDCDRYDTFDYHWLADWSAFLQRTATESRALLDQAGIAAHAITSSRTPDDVMIFYRARQAVNGLPAQLPGPHDRRQVVDERHGDPADRLPTRPKRPSWRRPEQTR